MMVEIPDVWIVLGWVLVVGLVSAVIIRQRSAGNEKMLARLEYYEKQIVEMKIRLDSMMYVDPVVVEAGGTRGGERQDMDREDRKVGGAGRDAAGAGRDVTGVVLKLIADGVVTSREIQITINRTREHTARLLKKLFEDGYVKRNAGTKPYTYSITNKGRKEIGMPDA